IALRIADEDIAHRWMIAGGEGEFKPRVDLALFAGREDARTASRPAFASARTCDLCISCRRDAGFGLSISLEAGDFRAKLIRRRTQWIVGKVGLALGCFRCVLSQQASDDLQTKAARNEMRSVSMPIVVPSIVDDSSF